MAESVEICTELPKFYSSISNKMELKIGHHRDASHPFR